MNARYYVPYLNRFISADTIVPDPANPQSFNRYSYALNNAINRIDPTGHIDCPTIEEGCAPALTQPASISQTEYENAGIQLLKDERVDSVTTETYAPLTPEWTCWGSGYTAGCYNNITNTTHWGYTNNPNPNRKRSVGIVGVSIIENR